MPFEPVDPLGGFTATGELPRPDEFDTSAPLTAGEEVPAAFRTENTIGSLIASEAGAFSQAPIDPDFDPWGEIEDTPYAAYPEQFARAANKAHFEAIKADIDRENKDRDIIARSGAAGIGASLGAGFFDLPTLLPGGAVARTAKGGVSLARTAGVTALAGAGAGAASEVVLQATQQRRTAEESAMVIGGSAVLAGLLGAGIGKLVSRAELDALAPRVERDMIVPGPGEPDPFIPGSFKPSVEAAPGASDKAMSVADAIRETAEEILPAQVRVQVVDSLGPVGDDGLFGLRAPNMADVSFAGTTARARAVGDDGAEIGFVSGTVKGDALIIDKTTLPETHQGKGYGVAMYRALIDAALDRGLRVESAYEVSEKASRVYDALARRGYKVERLPYRIEKKSGGRRLVVTDDLTRRPIAVTGKPEGPAREQLFSLRAKRYAAPEIETPDQIGDALKTIRESVEEAQTAPLKGRFSPDDLRSRFIAYKKADTDLRAALIGGLDPEDALARYAKLRGEAESIVNDLRKTDARINRDIEKDMKAREGKEQFALRGFYSPAIRAAESISMKKGTGEQFWKQITKTPGVRKDELDWMGVEEFMRDKPSVTRDEVLAFMRAHQVALDERVLARAGEREIPGTVGDPRDTIEWVREESGLQSDAEMAAWIDQYLADARSGQLPFELEPDDIANLQRARTRIAAGDSGTPTKFEGHKIPGGENYRELLIRLPGLEGKYKSKHFEDQEIVHLRVDDRTGPGGEKVLFINEVQSDLHQAGRKAGYDLAEKTAKAEALNNSLARLKQERDALIDQKMDAIGDRAREAQINERARSVRNEINETQEKIRILEGEDAAPNAPFKGDLWLELALKRALLYASENGYDAISWARSDQIAKAVGSEPEKLALQYDSKIGKFLDKYTKKWGAKVEEAAVVETRSNDGTRGNQRDLRNLDSQIAANERALGGELSDAARAQVETQLSLLREQRAALAGKDGEGVNPILRVTPQMRASVMEGQPLGVRMGPEGLIAEGRFDPDNLLITIAADALDPLKTLRHESIHALKTMGLFTRKDWSTLEAAAKKGKWLETHNVRGLYEGVYKDRITDELLLEEAIAEQFSLWRQGAIQIKGALAKLFQRIQQFLEATGNALRGRGFQTADDVFASVRSGEVASRAPGAAPPASGAIPAAGMGRATSVGASAVSRAEDTLKSALGLEKAFYWQDPMLRLQTSRSAASKRHVQELAETPLAYDKNALGEPTAPGGSEMGAPGAVETRMKFWQGALADAVQAVDQGFMKYRTGHAKRFTGETVLLNMRDTVYGTDALTYPQFKQEIAKALRRGDEHQLPEVAGAARIWRQKVLDPLKDEAIKHEMLPEGVTPETAPSYLNRLYNKDKIIAERDQFKTIVADWLEGQESINRGVRIKVAPLLERRKILEERVAKYERQIERRSAATAKIAARRQEASGLNRFAYSRAQKLSQPIDQVRGEIDTIASSIRTQLDRVEELSAAIREEKLNLPEIATVERQSIKIGHALADLKRDAALIDMVEAAESIEKPLAELYEASSGIMGALREQAKFARMTPQAQALVALEKDRAKLGRKIAPFRKKLRDLRTLQQKMEKARTPGARGGAVFESKIRSRVNTLADQEAGKKAAIEDMQMKLDRAQDELNVVTSKLEAEITAYQGKTAGDAKGAIKRRDTAEAARTPEQRAKKARLGSADKAVVTTARKIAAQLDKEPGEITSLADEIIDRILGTPDGRLPYDAHKNSATAHGASVDARGPLAARQFMIPDAAIERYLENDIEVLGRAYTRTMAADVEMTKRFGSVDMVDQIKEIAEDYARLSAQAKTPKERAKLHKQRDNDIRDLAAIRDRLRGTYALPGNPDGMLVRSGRVINSLNYMRMLGGMTISAIPDTARTVMVHGLMRTAGDGLVPLLRNWSGARLAMTEVKLAGTALDMVLDSRAMQIADIMDDFGRHSKFERAIQAGARNFGVISLMAPWNAAMKQFAGLVTMTRMLRAVERIAAGKAKPKEVAMLASGGISESHARKIAAQFAKHGSKEGGVWFANTAAWEERSAIEAFRAALVRDVDRIIVTPGQERPLWMSTETGRLIGQFKSFAISAMQRVLISGLQQRDMATLNGAIMMIALGGLASVIRAKASGQPAPDLSDGQKQAQFLVEAIDRSGLTGWMMEANSMTEKMTRGAVGLSAITGKPVSRYAQRNITGSLLGPTAGTMEDFIRVFGAAASGEWNQSDSRVMRRLVPYNNIFYARQMFDEAEAGINGFFGVPKPAGARR